MENKDNVRIADNSNDDNTETDNITETDNNTEVYCTSTVNHNDGILDPLDNKNAHTSDPIETPGKIIYSEPESDINIGS